MTINSYSELVEHFGHKIVVATYGDENATIECEDCSVVLVEFMSSDYLDEQEYDIGGEG